MKWIDFYKNTTVEELYAFFEEVAKQLNITNIIVEKDFWVCILLKVIFESKYSEWIYFKGGTSLSKAYHVINRFSEDIDLCFDPLRILNDDDKDKYNNLIKNINNCDNEISTKSQNNKISKYVLKKINEFFKLEFLDYLNKEFKKLLRKNNLFEFNDENLMIEFHYPSVIGTKNVDYIKRVILLEVSKLTIPEPISRFQIKPYLENYLPNKYKDSVEVQLIDIKRTFCDKLTILHAEANIEDKIHTRYFRHYYDVVKIWQKFNEENIDFDNLINLLFNVVNTKNVFYYSEKRKLNLIKEARLTLIPNERKNMELVDDFNDMDQSNMFFNQTINFEEIMQNLKKIQDKINSLILNKNNSSLKS